MFLRAPGTVGLPSDDLARIGKSWASPWDIHLIPGATVGSKTTLVQGNGALLEFTRTGTGNFSSAPGILPILTQETVTGQSTYIEHRDQKFIFDNNGIRPGG